MKFQDGDKWLVGLNFRELTVVRTRKDGEWFPRKTWRDEELILTDDYVDAMMSVNYSNQLIVRNGVVIAETRRG